LFAAECPGQVAAIDAAFATGSSEAVMRAAHTFKGSLGLIGAKPAAAAALRIETLGRENRLAEYPAAWTDLQTAVAALTSELTRDGAASATRREP
jgi:HPt (histidine-containing phosphotransfer) domain-containing protein